MSLPRTVVPTGPTKVPLGSRARGAQMQLRALSALAPAGLLAACSLQGEDHTIRVELWAGWVETDTAPGACEGGEAFAEFYSSDAEVALLDAEGDAVSRTTFGGGYIDRSIAFTSPRPSRVCAWEVSFSDVPELLRYRILWPDGQAGSVSYSPEELRELSVRPLWLEAGWEPGSG